MTCLANSAKLKVIKRGDPWIKVQYGDRVGYVWSPAGRNTQKAKWNNNESTSSESSAISKSEMRKSKQIITPDVSGCLNFRARPNGRKIMCVRNGGKLRVTGHRRGNWIPVSHAGKRGFVWSPVGRRTTRVISVQDNSQKPLSTQSQSNDDSETQVSKPIQGGAHSSGNSTNSNHSTDHELGAGGSSPIRVMSSYEVASEKIGKMVHQCNGYVAKVLKRSLGWKWKQRCAQVFRKTIGCIAKKMGNKACRMWNVACAGSAKDYKNSRCRNELKRCGWQRVPASDPRCNLPGAAHVFGKTRTTAGQIHGHIAMLDHKKRFRGNHKAYYNNPKRISKFWFDKKYCYILGNEIVEKLGH